MDISLRSSLITAQASINFHPLAHNCQWSARFVLVSCRTARRAPKLACKNESPNYYKLLGLRPENAGVDDIKRAYRQMSQQYHPDVCDPSMKEESTRMFIQLNAAYKTLSDPILQMQYDYDMGLADFRQKMKSDMTMKRWEEQILELKRRSSYRMMHKERSWGSRMRAWNSQERDVLVTKLLTLLNCYKISIEICLNFDVD